MADRIEILCGHDAFTCQRYSYSTTVVPTLTTSISLETYIKEKIPSCCPDQVQPRQKFSRDLKETTELTHNTGNHYDVEADKLVLVEM